MLGELHEFVFATYLEKCPTQSNNYVGTTVTLWGITKIGKISTDILIAFALNLQSI